MFEDIIEKKEKIIIKEFPMRTKELKDDLLDGKINEKFVKDFHNKKSEARSRAIKKLIKHAKSLDW